MEEAPTKTLEKQKPEDPMKPRPLTEEEIRDIVSVIPVLKAASVEAGTYNRESMLKTLREQLREIVVTPLGIEDIKKEILRQFNQSLIKPGTVVGVTAAEALGRQFTQGALNSFHQSGSAKNVSYGVSRIRELINASKEIKNTSCSIFFQDQNMSFDDVVMKVRPQITEIKINDIVKGVPDIEFTSNLEEPWWYGPYRSLIRDDFQSNSILILELDVDTMYAYKITMAQVAEVIERDQSVICVYSPLNIGIVHIYPIAKSIAARIKGGVIDKKNMDMIFLGKAMIPALDAMKLTGLQGINQIYPVEAPVWQIVKDEKPSTSVEGRWYLHLNPVRMRITGITVAKLITLCKTVGIEVPNEKEQMRSKQQYVVVNTPGNQSPTKLVTEAIKKDKEDEKEYEERKRKEGARVIRRPPSEIMTAGNLVYADSDGSLFKGNVSTLRELLSDPKIDSTRTYCNNVHEINAVLGIEAARSFLIKEFSDVIRYEGGYLNPRHIVLLVDFMVSLGSVNGITFSGTSKQDIDALAKASFERAMDTFKEASGFGEIEEVKGTSASIYVGKKALIGTGYSDQFMDASKFDQLEKEIDQNPDMKIDIGDFKDAIGEMDDVISGGVDVIMEGLEEEMFAGCAPILPGGEIKTTNKTIDPAANRNIKGPLIRSAALNEAAIRLNESPCLVGPPPPTVRVEDIKTPHSELRMAGLPFAGPTEPPSVQETTPQLEVPGYVPSAMGLPEGLLEEMKEFQYAAPPKVAPLPLTGLPSLAPVPPVSKVGEKVTEKKKKQPVMFDLDKFLG